MRKSLVLYILLFVLPASCALQAQQKQKMLIAAAADLKFALDSVITVFKQDHPQAQVDVTYGSSGKLFEQISNGAPFDLFFSADIQYPQQLKQKGLVASEVNSYGTGRIVLWSKKTDPNKAGMNTLLEADIIKIAVANPVHAPYGKRAEEALRYYKLYDKVKSQLVLGENISQTAQFVSSGAADAGIIALSLALSPAMQKERGKYYLIPDSSHKPLEQGFVITRHGKDNPLVRSFQQYILNNATGKAILQYFGFSESAGTK